MNKLKKQKAIENLSSIRAYIEYAVQQYEEINGIGSASVIRVSPNIFQTLKQISVNGYIQGLLLTENIMLPDEKIEIGGKIKGVLEC